MSEDMASSVLLCEGPQDRGFWAIILTRMGCKEARDRSPSTNIYALTSATGNLIHIVSCGTKEKVLQDAIGRLSERETNRITRLVLSIDADTMVGVDSGATGLRLEDVLAQAKAFDSNARINEDSEIEIDGGETKIALARWEVKDDPIPGIPDKQTLERLICSAMVAVYPERGECVHHFLASRKDVTEAIAKEYAWSYMAG